MHSSVFDLVEENGYDINHLAREAQTRWLKPVEVFFILQNYEEHQLTHQIPQTPASGSLYLFNKRVLKFFRKDGHRWRRRKDQRTIAEAHERLKVGNVEALNCYYAHGEENPNFQRRSYWILDPAYEHIVLVHYRDIGEGRQNAGSTSQFSSLSSTFSPSPNSFATQQPESSVVIGESYELYHNESSPSTVEINSSEVIKNHEMNHLDNRERTDEVNSSSAPDLSKALRRIEQQLSLNDDEGNEISTFYIQNEDSNDLEDVLRNYDLSGQTPNNLDNLLQQQSDDRIQQHQLPEVKVNVWNEMLDTSRNFPNVEAQGQLSRQYARKCKIPSWCSLFITLAILDFESTLTTLFLPASLIPQEVVSMKYPAYSPALNAYDMSPNAYSSFFDQNELGISLEDSISLTIAPKQKFTIREICPDWCYTSEGAKVDILRIFYQYKLLHNPICRLSQYGTEGIFADHIMFGRKC
ncbi:UNVERIFIED_CONTAM: Calmodulin-binding transcription activator 4 [Sesamum latifolium]|uniref:Calmodulin-binding transcription activator 4 n=1 Tax=Sesamum latifolium TaxID=2727402 RepID=A0AAW2UYP4_9LAMI